MASPLTVFASSNAADGALAGWSNPQNTYADDTSFATRSAAAGTLYGNLFGFDLSGVPDGATITSVTLLARFKGSASATDIQFFLGAKSGGSEVGSGTTDTTQTTSEEDVTYQPAGLTAANLKATGANGFWAIARYSRSGATPRIGYIDYITCTVEYTEGATPDELTSKDISSGVPAVDKPTIGQKHALTSKDVASGIPAVDKPTLSQKHALVSKDIITPVPTVDKPTIAQIHALTSKDISSSAPSVDKPTLASVAGTDSLTAQDIVSGAPSVDKPTLGVIEVSQDSAAAALFYRAKFRNDDDEVLAIYALLENEW